MSVKPDTPITKKEMYLDAATGSSSTLPEPVTIEEKYLAKIAGMTVDLPAPVPLKHKFLAKIAGMQVDVPTYTTGLPRIYAYLAKAAGQDVEVPQPITREEMYWFDYVSGQPTPSEQEYTGAVPVTFTANGQPLLDYLISGNTVQTGTPTPDSPITPEGCGERTENLFDKSKRTDNGRVVYTTGEIGVLSTVFVSDFTPIEPNTTYTLNIVSSINNKTGHLFALYDENKNFVNTGAHEATTATVYTFTTPSNVAYIRFNGNMASVDEIMLNTGSTPLPYEPYGYKIPISSADTTTPVYLGEVQSTRKIKKLVLTGEENFVYDSNYTRFRFTMPNSLILGVRRTPVICTHYETITDGRSIEDVPKNTIYSDSARQDRWWIEAEDFTSADDFKAYLAAQYAAETPVTIWYILTEPETAIVNEPLMKIGDYADTLSMEQAGVSVPTVAGSNTLDVLTEVKPSEVYIKYNGEPVSQLSMLSSPGTDEPEEAPEELSEEAEEIPEEEVPEETEEETENITPETEE